VASSPYALAVMSPRFETLSDAFGSGNEQKEAFGAHIGGKLKGYVDDGGMGVPQENHFLLAYR
jgi:hypothetical protein